ncbi:hypothetical protein [Streptomyces sp. NPDC046759]|uniref:hypothetical protein n=1 Tax=Streptomyces sp. NPDC046759 TaxID=3155019 RepID=UPI00340EDC84
MDLDSVADELYGLRPEEFVAARDRHALDARASGDPERPTKSDGKELRTAEQLIDALTMDWDPGDCHDTYVERVKKLVAAKRKGEEVVDEPAAPEATDVIDLMKALSRSVEQSRSRGRKDGRGKPATGRRPATGKKHATGKERASGKKRASGRRKTEDLTSLSKADLQKRASAAGVPGDRR